MSSPADVDFVAAVLAVDDCPAMRALMCASLEGRGYSVKVVDNGWAALDAAQQTPFDVIVLDVEMPGLDGMAVGRALRSSERTATAVIAMHTSIAEEVVRAGFQEYDAYVTKSGGMRSLSEQVDRLVRGRRAARSAPVSPARRDDAQPAA